MIQLYPISLFLIALASLYFLSSVYEKDLSFFLKIRGEILKSEKWRNIIFYVYLAFSILLLALPLYPGPGILGDLLPSLALLYAALNIKLEKIEKTKEQKAGKDLKKGLFFLLTFILHLIFPTFVLI